VLEDQVPVPSTHKLPFDSADDGAASWMEEAFKLKSKLDGLLTTARK
jgi:hypothetical protein